MAKSEEGRKLDLFQLKQCVVQMHDLVQKLYKEEGTNVCQPCNSKAIQKLQKENPKTPIKMLLCPSCKQQFMKLNNKWAVASLVDIILMMGDAGVPLPPKRDTWPT